MKTTIRSVLFAAALVLLSVALALALAVWSQASMLGSAGEMHSRATASRDHTAEVVSRVEDIHQLRSLVVAQMQATDAAGALSAQIATNTAQLAQWLLVVLVALVVGLVAAALAGVRAAAREPRADATG